MKRILIIPILAFALSGCAALQPVADFVGTATKAVTQTIVNPLGPVDIYRVKNVYAAGLTLADDYRTYCYSKPYAALMADPIAAPTCKNRRQVIRAMQNAAGTASNAIKTADKFIRDNPSGNAVSYVTAAWNAVQSFRATIPAVK